MLTLHLEIKVSSQKYCTLCYTTIANGPRLTSMQFLLSCLVPEQRQSSGSASCTRRTLTMNAVIANKRSKDNRILTIHRMQIAETSKAGVWVRLLSVIVYELYIILLATIGSSCFN